MKKESSSFQWFIEPLDDHTNEMIADKLAQESLGLEATAWSLRDDKGNRIDAWRVEHIFITKMERGPHLPELRYWIYRRPGSRGIVRKWKFSRKGPKAKVKEALEKLQELKKKKATQATTR